MLTVIAISLVLFILVTSFCKRQGLFDAGSMGFGQLCAFVLYAVVWALPTLAMLAGHFIRVS